MSGLLGADLMPATGILAGLFFRLGINLLMLVLLVRIYARGRGDRGYVFTFVLLNVVTFAVGFLLSKVPIQLGFAVGLFGVFGILRYRTEAVPARDLTYLFAVIGVALLNALSHEGISVAEIVIVNALVVATAAFLEGTTFAGREDSRQVLYDRLDLLSPGNSEALLADLRARTRLPVVRYEIGNLDLLKDTAAITIYVVQTPSRVAAHG